MDQTADDLIELYRAKNLAEAYALRAELEAANVRAVIDGEMLQGAVGELPMGWLTSPRVVVPRGEEAAARDILSRFVEQVSAREDGAEPPPSCLACGADMGEGDACPECGWTFKSEASDETIDDAVEPADSIGVASLAAEPKSRELWGEVGLVFAVAVIPHVAAAVYSLAPASPRPMWIDAVYFIVDSACLTYVVLYLIRRRGETLVAFGLRRFSLGDPFIGFALFVLPWVFLPTIHRLVPEELDFPVPFLARPLQTWERLLLVVEYGLSCAAEELVYRAYLITRLRMLWRSRAQAVVVAAGCFAAVHLYQGASGVVWTFVMGLAYGTYFVFARRVWPLVIGHALLDLYIMLR